jgi:hypothetical protein
MRSVTSLFGAAVVSPAAVVSAVPAAVVLQPTIERLSIRKTQSKIIIINLKFLISKFLSSLFFKNVKTAYIKI